MKAKSEKYFILLLITTLTQSTKYFSNRHLPSQLITKSWADQSCAQTVDVKDMSFSKAVVVNFDKVQSSEICHYPKGLIRKRLFNKDVGENCENSNECFTAYCSEKKCSFVAANGKCEELSYYELPYRQHCQENQYCKDGTCVDRLKKDENCSSSSECAEKLVCGGEKKAGEPYRLTCLEVGEIADGAEVYDSSDWLSCKSKHIMMNSDGLYYCGKFQLKYINFKNGNTICNYELNEGKTKFVAKNVELIARYSDEKSCPLDTNDLKDYLEYLTSINGKTLSRSEWYAAKKKEFSMKMAPAYTDAHEDVFKYLLASRWLATGLTICLALLVLW